MSIASFTIVSPATLSNAPFTTGHAFKKGQVPAGAALNSSSATIQVVKKNAWSDGSLKYAIISGVANLTGNIPLSVPINYGPAVGGAALTIADLKATGITASIATDVFGGASWSNTDWDAPHKTWITGPVMSSWLYRKQIGTDAHLVGWLEVRLYQTGNVEVLPWVENGYLMEAAPTNKAATYSFTLNGVQKYSASLNFLHHTRSPLLSGTALSYWTSTDPQVVPRLDVVYLQQTELVPTYSTATTTSNLSSSISTSATYTPFLPGGFIYSDNGYGNDAMQNSGYERPTGLLPTHDVAYLVCDDNHELLYGAVVRNGFFCGRYPIHYRDKNTQNPLKFSDWPDLCLGNGSGVYNNGASSVMQTPDATGGYKTYDPAHSPSVGFMAYLITGRYYFLEELQFAVTVNYLAKQRVIRGGSQNLLLPEVGAWQTRACAWTWRTLSQALCVTPDDDTTGLRAEFKTSAEININSLHTTYVAQANNPFGFIKPGDSYGAGSTFLATWQQDFVTAAFGYSLGLDIAVAADVLTKLKQFFQWKAKSAVVRMGSQSDFWYINGAPYVARVSPVDNPDYDNGTGPWYANPTEMYSGTYDPSTRYTGTVYDWMGATDGTLAAQYTPGTWATSMWGNLHPALAYAVRYGVPGAEAAYSRMTSATNYNSIQTTFNTAPVWSVQPLTVGAPTTVIGPCTIVDSQRLRAGYTVVSKYRGTGIPAADIPSTGASGAALLYNDIDATNDPADTLYRVELLTQPSAGTLIVYEDSSFSFTGAPDGAYAVNQRVYKNGVAAYDTTLTLTIGTVTQTLTLTPATTTSSSVCNSTLLLGVKIYGVAAGMATCSAAMSVVVIVKGTSTGYATTGARWLYNGQHYTQIGDKFTLRRIPPNYKISR